MEYLLTLSGTSSRESLFDVSLKSLKVYLPSVTNTYGPLFLSIISSPFLKKVPKKQLSIILSLLH